MNPVQRLIADLVKKKLWPVALVLVTSAVAIPLLIGGGGGDAGSEATDPSIAPAPAALEATSAVELVGPPAVRSRPGAVRDPFRRKKTDDAKSGSGSSSSSGGSGTSSAKGSPARSDAKSGAATSGAKQPGSSSNPTAAAPKPAAPTPKAAAPKPPSGSLTATVARSAYQTVARTTRPGGDRERPLKRLSVVGNAANPAVQFLGVGDDGEYAIFVLGPKATASGDDGACVVVEGCRVIGLRRGDKLGVDVAGAGDSSRHYEIEVIRVRRLRMAATQATAWRKRVDPIGREVQSTIGEDVATAAALGRLRYSTSTGTIGLTNAP